MAAKERKEEETMSDTQIPENLGVVGQHAHRMENDEEYRKAALTPPDLKRGPGYDDTDQYTEDGTTTKELAPS